jgi:hypothetical protein
VSETSLKLNLNSTAVPPVGFVLTVTDIVEDATGLTGMTIVPLPKEIIAGMITPLNLSPSAQALFMLKISIEFMEK